MYRFLRLVCAVFLVTIGTSVSHATVAIVNQVGTTFSPSTVTIAIGDSVRWVWSAGSHTTTNGTGAADPQAGLLWDAPLNSLTPTFTRQFLAADTIPFFCRPHEIVNMKGTVIILAAPNQAPVARDSSHSTPEETGLSTTLPASDPDSNPLEYTITQNPVHGAISGFNNMTGDYTYTPELDYNGPDSLKFEVFDGIATSNEATVQFTVTAINDPPVADDLPVSVTENTATPVGAMPVTDVDDANWTVTQTAGPFHGMVTGFNAATGSFTYTPDTDYSGPDSIKYIADDGSAESDTGTVRIDVVPGCDCPNQGDVAPIATSGDGVVNVLDVVALIDFVFRSGPPLPTDFPGCPRDRSDLAPLAVCGDATTNVLDVVFAIDRVFRSGPAPCDPCSP